VDNIIKIILPSLENGEPRQPSKNTDGKYDEVEMLVYKAAFSEYLVRSKEAKLL